MSTPESTIAAFPEPKIDGHGDPSWRIEGDNGLGLDVAIYLEHGFPVIETRDDHGETHLLSPDVLRQLARVAPGIADRAEQLAAEASVNIVEAVIFCGERIDGHDCGLPDGHLSEHTPEAPPDTEAAG